jgi:hypothetical protein
MSFQTTAEILKLNRKDLDVVIRDVLEASPFLQVAAARSVASDNFKYSKLITAPSASYRAANVGVDNTPSGYEEVSIALKYLDASFSIDTAVAKVDERGVDHAVGLEALAALRAAMVTVENNIFQGNDSNPAVTGGGVTGGFEGLPGIGSLNALADSQVVSAGSGTLNANTSVYGITFGESGFELLWGEGGELTVSERMMVKETSSSTLQFWAYAHEIAGYCGMKNGSIHSIHRLVNLDATNKLTDDLIGELIANKPVGQPPFDVIVMNRTSLKNLRESRTTYSPTGAPAPFPSQTLDGIPIVVTDSILNTEATVS